MSKNELNITKAAPKTTLELKKELTATGCEVNMVYANGRPLCVAGYTDDKDKKAMMDALQIIVDNTHDAIEATRCMMKIGEMTRAGIDGDEEVNVEGRTVILNYEKQEAYVNNKKVADLADLHLPSVGKETIKTLLIERVKLAR